MLRRPEATWTDEHSRQVRAASLELVTLLRQEATSEARAAAFSRYVEQQYLPSLNKEHRAQGLGMLLAGLALDFAAVLDRSDEAAQVFLRHALATAAKPLG